MLLVLIAWFGLVARTNAAAPNSNRATAAPGCSTIFNLPDFLQKPHDQGNLGWCYAYAAADLASAYQGEQVSAADIAIAYNYAVATAKPAKKLSLNTNHEEFEALPAGGDPASALSEMLGNGTGFCRESDFPSDVLTKISENEKLRKTEITRTHLEDRLESVFAMSRMQATPVTCPSDTFPNVDLSKISEVLRRSEGGRSDPDGSIRLAALERLNCDGRRVPAKFTDRQMGELPLSIKNLNEVLARGAVGAVGLQNSEESHAALLVGRIWDPEKKQCNFIFKDNQVDSEHPERQKIPGFTLMPESEMRKARGSILTVRAAAKWSKAPLPTFVTDP